jgi:2-methylaconitate cis-trans-isomerase PrpF
MLQAINQKERNMKPLQFVTRTLGVAALALTSLAAVAGTISLKADLKGASEVPVKDASGTGKVEATLNTDTNEFSYHVVFSGLTGVPVAAHFHGPAGE